jgi:hypothetical protein
MDIATQTRVLMTSCGGDRPRFAAAKINAFKGGILCIGSLGFALQWRPGGIPVRFTNQRMIFAQYRTHQRERSVKCILR